MMTTPLIGVSKSILKIKELISHVANTSLNVLITGETGVGKEVVAHSLFRESNRSSQNFVKINCAALPETLLESELYGYEKGAFTGAHKKRQGKFKMADKGMLFLDEIGDMPLSLQSKILHVLQSGEFSPLGSDEDFKTDVWVIAATNHNLEERILQKQFREDLFYRLNIIKIDIPPLRERREDIPVLIDYYYRIYADEYGALKMKKPDGATLERLCNYSWPGNIRQLQNCIKKQMVLKSWDKIFYDLPGEGLTINTPSSPYPSLSGSKVYQQRQPLIPEESSLIAQFVDLSTSSEKLFEDISLKRIKKMASDRVEMEVISFVLRKMGWNRSRAAKVLKVSYKTLLYKMTEFDIQPPVK